MMKAIFLMLLMVPGMSVTHTDDDEIVIFMIGDSTMENKTYQGSNPRKGWGQVFPLYFKPAVQVKNYALGGRSTKSFRDEGHWQTVKSQLQKGNYVIIQFGHNDSKSEANRYAEADTDFRQNLIRYVLEAREREAIPILCTPIVRRLFDGKGNLVDTHGAYPQVTREVAAQLGVPLLELHVRTAETLRQMGAERSRQLFLHFEPGDYEGWKGDKEDNTHLSGTGAFKVCDLAVAELKREVPQLVPYFNP
ncbi:rhamnogalacturonan acetylesterase [Parapedobacter sp. 2B3]|uniref:rhamnogalacturonan acetylesterase n=1 Tax=Parapedobacter sp. 2B3 TaxID=3342381 RepID=UPI000FC1C0F6|nr:MAG: rhamnogalacturonan acetylesterase [Parapedobacter sp.]